MLLYKKALEKASFLWLNLDFTAGNLMCTIKGRLVIFNL